MTAAPSYSGPLDRSSSGDTWSGSSRMRFTACASSGSWKERRTSTVMASRRCSRKSRIWIRAKTRPATMVKAPRIWAMFASVARSEFTSSCRPGYGCLASSIRSARQVLRERAAHVADAALLVASERHTGLARAEGAALEPGHDRLALGEDRAEVAKPGDRGEGLFAAQPARLRGGGTRGAVGHVDEQHHLEEARVRVVAVGPHGVAERREAGEERQVGKQ